MSCWKLHVCCYIDLSTFCLMSLFSYGSSNNCRQSERRCVLCAIFRPFFLGQLADPLLPLSMFQNLLIKLKCRKYPVSHIIIQCTLKMAIKMTFSFMTELFFTSKVSMKSNFIFPWALNTSVYQICCLLSLCFLFFCIQRDICKEKLLLVQYFVWFYSIIYFRDHDFLCLTHTKFLTNPPKTALRLYVINYQLFGSELRERDMDVVDGRPFYRKFPKCLDTSYSLFVVRSRNS